MDQSVIYSNYCYTSIYLHVYSSEKLICTFSYSIILHPLLLMVQVCDEPHPLLIKEMLTHCVSADIDKAYQILKSLWDKGYSPHDIITNIFRVCKNHQIAEYLKLEFIKV